MSNCNWTNIPWSLLHELLMLIFTSVSLRKILKCGTARYRGMGSLICKWFETKEYEIEGVFEENY